MKRILIVQGNMLKACLLTVLLALSISGLTQGLTAQDSLYRLTGTQIEEIHKVAHELEECNKTVLKLSSLADTAQFKINVLDSFIHDKNKQLATEKKRKKSWRRSTIGLIITGVLLILIK